MVVRKVQVDDQSRFMFGKNAYCKRWPNNFHTHGANCVANLLRLHLKTNYRGARPQMDTAKYGEASVSGCAQ